MADTTLIEAEQRVKARIAELHRKDPQEDQQIIEVAARDDEILSLSREVAASRLAAEKLQGLLDEALKARDNAMKMRHDAVKAALEAKAVTEKLRRDVACLEELLEVARKLSEKHKEKQKRAWAETAKFREEVVELKRQLKDAVLLAEAAESHRPGPAGYLGDMPMTTGSASMAAEEVDAIVGEILGKDSV